MHWVWHLGLGAVGPRDAVSCLTQLHLRPSTSYFEILFVPVVRIDWKAFWDKCSFDFFNDIHFRAVFVGNF